jgi:hypothetical protein
MTLRMIALAALTSAGLVAVPAGFATTAFAQPANISFGARTDDAMNERLKTVFGESLAYKGFFERLQTAVADGEKMTVARMVAYPFSTQVDGEQMTLRNRWQFHKVYDQVMTPGVVAAIEDHGYQDMIVGKPGVGLGEGDLWFADVDDSLTADIKIIAINQRAGAGV